MYGIAKELLFNSAPVTSHILLNGLIKIMIKSATQTTCARARIIFAVVARLVDLTHNRKYFVPHLFDVESGGVLET